MPRTVCAFVLAFAVLTGAAGVCPAAPPGPADLMRSIETARNAIAENEKILTSYGNELRTVVGNDPASIKRREEIRILKQYYVHEIEDYRAKIADDYRKIQEYKARGVQ
ncbi:conserved hypothetical protein [Solidesulfovibrio fructosivorans JJ]]|uniref:Uncharacterized protein n=1 Tax=Solidesulfovibrio fructosivorans JJ] TaxID=596151 RepID=E1JWI0_SOLFR|nr:hypothetical protein [Solidesulfovibrio fructosivorans]EFL51277.1 conserved hypothetical protein [Solidesulfovibrio fructosivorans JJ]]